MEKSNFDFISKKACVQFVLQSGFRNKSNVKRYTQNDLERLTHKQLIEQHKDVILEKYNSSTKASFIKS